ncbi:MAG: enoyl-CoA hydratase/isomerase family protein [Bryobacterales bacterium]|nr:enoyl-CoA hydratase/isomerase family protein [Bryobacterales bacterium]
MKKDLERGVLRLTLARPEKRNALTFAMCRELVQAFEQADRDTAVGAVLLQGEGKAFCAGMDLEEALQPDAAAQAAVHEPLFTVGLRTRKPIVAAVHGPALGGGAGLVANAHIVIASEEASFGLTEVRLGLWPFVVFRAVAWAVGERRTLELALTGRIFGADEAQRLGLVHEVVPASLLAERATSIAATLAASSQEAVRLGLEFVHRTRGMSVEQAGALAGEFRARAFASRDFAEGVRAFRERRPAKWPSLAGGDVDQEPRG